MIVVINWRIPVTIEEVMGIRFCLDQPRKRLERQQKASYDRFPAHCLWQKIICITVGGGH